VAKKVEKVEVKEATPEKLGYTESFYVPMLLKPNMDRVETLCKAYHLSKGVIMNLLVDACIDTLVKEVPIHRRFTLNNKEVIL